MSGDRTTEFQMLIDRLNAGDERAIQELVGEAYERLRRLAKKILYQDFPRLKHVYSTHTVLHEAAIRFLKALEAVRPPTVKDFFQLAAAQIRRTLLNLTRRHGRKEGRVLLGLEGPEDDSQGSARNDPAVTTLDPAALALWTEFHEKVEELPDREREVVDLYWYEGLSQREAGEVLGVSQSTISRLLRSAFRQLPKLPA